MQSSCSDKSGNDPSLAAREREREGRSAAELGLAEDAKAGKADDWMGYG